MTDDLRLVLMSCCAPCSAGAIKQVVGAYGIRPKNETDGGVPACAGMTNTPLQISDFIVLFYNPNIFPESEYQKRLAEQIRYCESLGVKYAVWSRSEIGDRRLGSGNSENESTNSTNLQSPISNLDYASEHAKWLSCVRGLENEPERGSRCAECFKFRFAFGVQWAREHGYNAIASVFGVSRHKDQAQVDAAAVAIVGAYLSFPRRRERPQNETDVGVPACAGMTNSPLRYIPIQWDESLRQEINRESDFYRQNYCGCEFSIKK